MEMALDFIKWILNLINKNGKKSWERCFYKKKNNHKLKNKLIINAKYLKILFKL